VDSSTDVASDPTQIETVAPAYSLAATLGFIVAVGGVGVHPPAVLIVKFIPILFVSVGYRFLNLTDPDAGTTFAWVTRGFGPQIGWVNGWAISRWCGSP
jgi:amino acid transporter